MIPMLGYSKGEWIFSGVLFVVLVSWILWPTEEGPVEPAPARASTAEIQTCAGLIRQSANNPSTVVLHLVIGTSSDKQGPGGTSRVQMNFEAKNAFGLETKYRAICQFDGGPSIQIFDR
jgi:hypothetical protein